MRIYEYPLYEPDGGSLAAVPDGWVPLSLQNQDVTPTVWAKVDPSAKLRMIELRMVPTGGIVPEHFTYLGTLQDGELVWHYYWRYL